MSNQDLKEALVNAAIDWRIADEVEPIPSEVVKKKHMELVYAIDAFMNAEGIHHTLLRNYKRTE